MGARKGSEHGKEVPDPLDGVESKGARKPKRGGKPKRGRPPVYDDDFHPVAVVGYAQEGLSQYEIAEKFGIGESTIRYWRTVHDTFSAAFEEGRARAVAALERVAMRRAEGFEIEETQIVAKMVGSGGMAPVEVRTTTKQVLPEPGMIKFLLTNWAPNQYQEKLTVDRKKTGRDFEDMTDDELRSFIYGSQNGEPIDITP